MSRQTLCLRRVAAGALFVKESEQDIRKFGHRRKVTLRSDREPAIHDLLEKVAELRGPETIIEGSPATDSRANGRAERAVQSVEKQVRVLKMSTEEQLGQFSVLHPAFPWLVKHAGDVITKFHVQKDGLTAYERVKGREYSGLMLEFGSAVRVKFQGKTQGGLMKER